MYHFKSLRGKDLNKEKDWLQKLGSNIRNNPNNFLCSLNSKKRRLLGTLLCLECKFRLSLSFAEK